LQTRTEWSYVYMCMVRFSVRIMILTSSLFKVVAYPAAWRAGVPTLTSSLRPRRYIIPSLVADLLGCISAYKKGQTNKKQIPWSSCGYGARGNYTSTWLWSEGGKTRAKAICTGPHPIKRKRERKKERKNAKLIPFLHYRGFSGWLRWNLSTSSCAFRRFSAGSQLVRTYLYPAHWTR